jgi:hypothetical protein
MISLPAFTNFFFPSDQAGAQDRNIRVLLEVKKQHGQGYGQVKSFNGSLESTWSVGTVGGQIGTHLDGTVAIIETTCKAAMIELAECLRSLQGRVRKESDVKQNAENFTRLFQRNSNICQAVLFIDKVYSERYHAIPEHPGLAQLQRYSIEFKKSLNSRLIESKACFEQLKAHPPKRINAHAKLEDFIASYCPETAVKDAREMIGMGQQILGEILSGKMAEPSDAGVKAMNELECIVWALMSHALIKSQGFREGTFVIDDPDRLIFHFLLHYKNVSIISDKTWTEVPVCYERPSSHWAGRYEKQYGIDSEVMNIFGKRTLLLGEIYRDASRTGDPLLFIKPENFSWRFTFYEHNIEFVEAQWNKVMHPGSDDQADMRKERVPVCFTNLFRDLVCMLHTPIDKAQVEACLDLEAKELLCEADGTFKSIPELCRKAKMYGISWMLRVLEALKKPKGLDKHINIRDYDSSFQQLITAQEYLDHLDLRTGREVFLDDKEISQESQMSLLRAIFTGLHKERKELERLLQEHGKKHLNRLLLNKTGRLKALDELLGMHASGNVMEYIAYLIKELEQIPNLEESVSLYRFKIDLAAIEKDDFSIVPQEVKAASPPIE